MERPRPLKENVRVTYRDTRLAGGAPGFDQEAEAIHLGQSFCWGFSGTGRTGWGKQFRMGLYSTGAVPGCLVPGPWMIEARSIGPQGVLPRQVL